MNRTVIVQTPVAVATLALAAAVSVFGYATVTGHSGSTVLTPTERQAAVKVQEAQASRAAAFSDCAASTAYPATPC
jgi:hypothetical protein